MKFSDVTVSKDMNGNEALSIFVHPLGNSYSSFHKDSRGEFLLRRVSSQHKSLSHRRKQVL